MSGTPRLQNLLALDEAPELGPRRRNKTLSEAEVNRTVDQALGSAGLRGKQRELIRALVLLWHDHLDPAHTIAQDVDDPDGAFVHGIMHRREPDYGNAKYWFRRVGQHPAFGPLAERAAALLDFPNQPELRGRLLRNGKWDPFAFVDACERAGRLPGDDPAAQLLRQIQRIETESLLEHLGA